MRSGIRSFFFVFCLLGNCANLPLLFPEFQKGSSGRFSWTTVIFKPDIRNDLVYLIRQFADILEGFFRGQILIGFMMGVGYAIGFSVAGLKFGIALGLLFGVLNIVPFLGTILGVLSVFTVSYLQTGGVLESGQWDVMWGCGVTFLVVQLLESYWLSPRVMGERTGLHPVVIIASVFSGVQHLKEYWA